METDYERNSPVSRADSPETVFNNDFSDVEEENEVEDGIRNAINAEDEHDAMSNGETDSSQIKLRHVSLEDEVETDGTYHSLSLCDGAKVNTLPGRSEDLTKSDTNCMKASKETDIGLKIKQSVRRNDAYEDSLTHGWALHEEDLLCVPLILNKTRAADGQSMSVGRYAPGKRKKTSAMQMLKKRSGKGSYRVIYTSPLTKIANIAKTLGYDLPTFLETSEFMGGPSLQLPCMQCYEKYGGKGGAGLDSMMGALSGEGSSSNGKCLTCGGQVQTMASFGRMIRQMRDVIEKKGLVPHDVYPDGNCLFAAVVDQLRIRGDFSFTTHTLRQSAVKYLKENPTTNDGTPLEMFLTDDETWETYLSRMSDDGEWGDHMILGALANVINMPIVIYGGTTGQNETILYPRALTNENGLSEKDDQVLDDDIVVYLGHVSESHYLSLRPKHWRQTLQKGLHQRKTSVESTSAEKRWTKCPVLHIDFILRQVFRMDLIKHSGPEALDVLIPSRMETPDCNFEMFGSLICKMVPCKVKLDSFGPDISMYFPCVKEEENIDGFLQNSAYSVFNTPYDTNIVSKTTSAKTADLIADDTAVVGHLKLIPKSPKIWKGQTISPKENTTYLNAFEVDFSWSEDLFPSKLSKDSPAMYLMLAFKCSWPDCAKHWSHRYRESGFPDEHTIQTVVKSGCHVIPLTPDFRMSDILDDPIHFMTSVDDHTWCYSFAAAEKEICRFLSTEQRQSFLVFKALVDVTLKDIPLPPSVVKSIFFYACENIEKQYWKSKPGECLLIILKKFAECLKNRHVQHYFMREKNLLDFIPEKAIDECFERLNNARLQPVVTLYFLLDQLNIMSSEIGCFVEEIIESIKVDAQTTTGVSIASESLLPACIEFMKDLIFQEDFQAAMLVFQDILEERGNSLETNGIDLMKKDMWDLHIGFKWCFALYVDIKQKTTLTAQVCEGYSTVHITEVFGPSCIVELPDTLVPECFSIDSGDLLFVDTTLEILLQTVSGRMFIKCMKFYLKRYGELAGDSLIIPTSSVTASNAVTGKKTSMMVEMVSMITSSASLLYELQNIYVRLFNFCDKSNMVEEFREMMPLYSLIAKSLGTQLPLANLAYMWESLGEGKKAETIRRKAGVGQRSSTFKKIAGSLLTNLDLD
ncbi:uncharacterized protein LOC123561456 [Mercenaria mercenaria]|uniref:uncharacterized protein LOC123561456 n=1 Tax=Mercenaria mercenaria TaxID=6596 RepID=UPI00234F13B8|nr:uncharacterized protein LOC123561456 [Mercenaria mercenaria]XP_045209766.2 uncharacterized protein LOC123561456 [Mercenaria mercenaria]